MPFGASPIKRAGCPSASIPALNNGIGDMTIRCVLMDIDGTIISVAFVRDWLFPYAQCRIAFFLREQREKQVVCQCATVVRTRWHRNGAYGPRTKTCRASWQIFRENRDSLLPKDR